MPLLLLFAIIFDIIAIAATSGWVEDEEGTSHYSSMWEECRGRNDSWDCRSLMEFRKCPAVCAALRTIRFLPSNEWEEKGGIRP